MIISVGIGNSIVELIRLMCGCFIFRSLEWVCLVMSVDCLLFSVRVSIYQRLYSGAVPLKSCGVHLDLVMPPNEVCMKLSHAQNLRNRLKAEDEELKRRRGPSGLKRLIFNWD
ncbi:uncharacterized protein LOC121050404 [Rosa chinensis]|uniref:uncharacterized protein LOC121050404 n=1 Tax=Rosa chinensis TaxID=74649 RepID=UPI001AD8A667|nr:uncharacterized protein LOC121050404 [Rosa chinensis]